MREPRARLRPLRRTSSALLFLGSYNHSQAHVKKVRTFINRFKITTDVYVHPIKVRRAERERRAVVIRIVVRACKRVVMCACTLTIFKIYNVNNDINSYIKYILREYINKKTAVWTPTTPVVAPFVGKEQQYVWLLQCASSIHGSA